MSRIVVQLLLVAKLETLGIRVDEQADLRAHLREKIFERFWKGDTNRGEPGSGSRSCAA